MWGFVRGAVFAAGIGLIGSLGMPSALNANDEVVVSVNANMARVLRIGAPAATVIIGNPAIADVTIQDPQTLILTGRSYGRTNLIILDAHGEPVADTIVEVTQQQSDTVTVFMGAQRTSVACAPNCQPVIMLGDDTAYTAGTVLSSSIVSDAARY